MRIIIIAIMFVYDNVWSSISVNDLKRFFFVYVCRKIKILKIKCVIFFAGQQQIIKILPKIMPGVKTVNYQVCS